MMLWQKYYRRKDRETGPPFPSGGGGVPIPAHLRSRNTICHPVPPTPAGRVEVFGRREGDGAPILVCDFGEQRVA